MRRRLVIDDDWAGRYLLRASSGLPTSDGIVLFDGTFGKSVACMRDGGPVGLLEVDGRSVELIYVSPGYRRQGIASEMFRFAISMFGPISHGKKLTDDGRLWAMSFNCSLELTRC